MQTEIGYFIAFNSVEFHMLIVSSEFTCFCGIECMSYYTINGNFNKFIEMQSSLELARLFIVWTPHLIDGESSVCANVRVVLFRIAAFNATSLIR